MPRFPGNDAKRQAHDGICYTRSDFLAHYGNEAGEWYWEHAATVAAPERATAQLEQQQSPTTLAPTAETLPNQVALKSTALIPLALQAKPATEQLGQDQPPSVSAPRVKAPPTQAANAATAAAPPLLQAELATEQLGQHQLPTDSAATAKAPPN